MISKNVKLYCNGDITKGEVADGIRKVNNNKHFMRVR